MLYICIMKYYIYTLSHPNTNEIRYIGKTVNTAKRYSAHLKDKAKSYKTYWIKSLLNQNLLPKLEILDEFEDEKECYLAEIYWIDQFKSWGFNLVNTYSGGKGALSSDLKGENNTRAKINTQTVLSIKNYLLTSDLSIDSIAKLHCCSTNTVNNIKFANAWAEVTGFTGNERWGTRKESVEKGKKY